MTQIEKTDKMYFLGIVQTVFDIKTIIFTQFKLYSLI
jgi:hypothetical protein